ncbi:MAG: transcriptional regulator [Erysipelotrichaceae bacterium]|nr:transcriptional regulator [Erysipelotrichaceae bacterium]
MKHYEQLLLHECFTYTDACSLVGNKNSANSFLQSYLKNGYIQSVRRNLYVVMNIANKTPLANRYEIGSHINETSYISHFSALSYYGYTNQVVNEVTVSSDSVFRNFEYSGIKYIFLKSRINEGVITTYDEVRISDLERTVIDCINDFEKVGGLEELLRSLSLIPYLDEKKLLKYLSTYNKQALTQKAGYILEHFKHELNISDDFFDACSSNIKNSIKYFTKNKSKERTKYNSRWQMFVPKDLLSIIGEGDNKDDII